MMTRAENRDYSPLKLLQRNKKTQHKFLYKQQRQECERTHKEHNQEAFHKERLMTSSSLSENPSLRAVKILVVTQARQTQNMSKALKGEWRFIFMWRKVRCQWMRGTKEKIWYLFRLRGGNQQVNYGFIRRHNLVSCCWNPADVGWWGAFQESDMIWREKNSWYSSA